MSFVLDNSVVSAWLLASQATGYSAGIAKRLEHERAAAPALLRLEYTNVLRTACKRQRLIASQAQELLRSLSALPIDIDIQAVDAGLLLALALRHDLSSYDAAYLELALRLQVPIATQDAALSEAARNAGVGLVSAE